MWPPAAAAGLGGVADRVAGSGGGGLALTFSAAEVVWTEPIGFSTPGLLPPPGGVGKVGLVSSGIAGKVQLSGPQILGRTLISNSLAVRCQRARVSGSCSSSGCLKFLDQIPNPFRIPLAVSMTEDRGGSTRGINPDLRPHEPGRNLYRSHFSNGNALLIAAEQPGLYTQDMLRSNHNACWKQEIASSPAAGDKSLGLRNWINHVQSGSHPLQSALLPNPDVTDHKD